MKNTTTQDEIAEILAEIDEISDYSVEDEVVEITLERGMTSLSKQEVRQVAKIDRENVELSQKGTTILPLR